MLNLTPHSITLRCLDGAEVVFPPSGIVARVVSEETLVGTIDVSTNGHSIAVVSRSLGAVTGLPAEGTECIVSAMVLSAVPGRSGVYAPDSGATAVRNAQGQVIAVTRLVAA